MQTRDDVLANWNGELMPLSAVRVSVLDRAFLFGDSVYEVIRVYGGYPFRISEHLARLQTGLTALKISFAIETIRNRAMETISKSEEKEALVYIQITRGVAPRKHHYPLECEPNCLIYVQAFADEYGMLRDQGARAITYADIRWAHNEWKTTSLVANCMAAEAAQQKGCIEAILANQEGVITEGSHSNVFAVRGGTVITPAKKASILPGITRGQIEHLCHTGKIPIVEQKISISDLPKLDELFITSTPEEIMPIVQVDDIQIGDGCVGKITRNLQDAFKQQIKQWLSETAGADLV